MAKMNQNLNGVDNAIRSSNGKVLRRAAKNSSMNIKVYRSEPMVGTAQDVAGTRMVSKPVSKKPDIMKLVKDYIKDENPRKYSQII